MTYTITAIATATIEETWEIDAPEGVEIDADEALDLLREQPKGYAVRFITDRVTGDETDREITRVSPGSE